MPGIRPATVSVVGLGYVGLSLAVALGRRFRVIGFDIDKRRVDELLAGNDHNAMFPMTALKQDLLTFTCEPDALSQADLVVIAVPTPVGEADEPDLTALRGASKLVGERLHKGSIVVYESTVYPGCTEEDCVPILEAASGLVAHRDFGVSYSPERIDPGDQKHGLEGVVKVVSAGDPDTLETVANMYSEVVTAGVHRAPDIRTAEAAKVIENIQRDLNIALMNELSMLFHIMGIDTSAVLRASGTKWNFGKYFPGLVGGHCIPVDPYYLVHKARTLGFNTHVILAGRRTNDSMASYVAEQGVELLKAAGHDPGSARALVLGLTFKEDVRDTRNAQASLVVSELEAHGLEAWTSDPIAPTSSLAGRHHLADPFTSNERFDLVILAVPHAQYRATAADAYLRLLENPAKSVFMDLRGILPRPPFEEAGTTYWSL